ncbi:MAG: hypothetical protein MUF34_03105 [Polyangiaceae bacterium]|jgi:hypothetical protein|nr:hypothetical protein [Polyangiaceae bacterium]
MIKRAALGLGKGLFVGALIAAALVFGFERASLIPAAAYVMAALAGVLTGLIAGKPIWHEGARIEAGLKAFFGALLGVGALYALQRWAPLPSALVPMGRSLVGDVSVAAFPLIAALLGLIYEVDNTPSADEPAQKGAEAGAKPALRAPSGVRLSSKAGRPVDLDENDEDVSAVRRAKR